MTLQASGPISHSQICNEFLAPTNTPMSSLYRGGAYVPNIAPNNNIPTSGAISYSDFYSTTRLTDHSTTVTVGSVLVGAGSYHDLVFTYYIPWSIYAFGYDGGPDAYSSSNFGSLADNTYYDGGATERTIYSCYWSGADSGGAGMGNLWFALNGNSVPNTNTTFIGLVIDGNSFPRSSTTNYYPSGLELSPANTGWVWGNVTNPFGTSGTKSFVVDVV